MDALQVLPWIRIAPQRSITNRRRSFGGDVTSTGRSVEVAIFTAVTAVPCFGTQSGTSAASGAFAASIARGAIMSSVLWSAQGRS